MIEAQPPEAALVLISTFKSTTTFNPEESVVYPILLQDSLTIDSTLQRVQ
jgi:hypothetical protein